MSAARYKVPTIEDIASTEAGRSALVKHAKGEPMNQHEVGAMLGISHATVSEIELRALNKLRDAILSLAHKDDTQTIRDARVERAERIAEERKQRRAEMDKAKPPAEKKKRKKRVRPPDHKAEQILRYVCVANGIDPKAVAVADRTHKVVAERNRVWWLMRNLRDKNGPISYKRIGRATGGHDHTSVMHGVSMHAATDFDRRTIKRLQGFIDGGKP